MKDIMSLTDADNNAKEHVDTFTESFERFIMPIYEREFGSTTGIESALETYDFTEDELVKCEIDTENLDKYRKFELLGKILLLGIKLIESADLGVKDFKILSYLTQTEAEKGYREMSVLRVAFKAQYKNQKIHRVYLIHSNSGKIEIQNSYEELSDTDANTSESAETNFFK